MNYDYHSGTGLLHTATGITDGTEFSAFESYTPGGKIGYIYHDGNMTATAYDYDPRSTRLLSINTLDTNPNPDLVLQEKAYKYTKAGDIYKITDTKDAQNITYNYGYDKLHRLISETSADAPADFGAATLVKTFANNAPLHAPKSVVMNGTPYNYGYDNNGNMTSGWDFSDPTQAASRTITYNADNMPKTIVHAYSGTTSLKYDGDGTRVKKVSGGSTTYYIGKHFEVAGGQEIKYIFAGNLRIAKVTGSGKSFFHKDHLGSSTVMTNPAGSVVETSEYLPFGLSRKHTGSEVTYYKFTDQELDSEVGLYNYNARLYDPAAGIFISPDSVVPKTYNPQSLNRYSYCNNNPLVYKDPDGHAEFHVDVSGNLFGGVLGTYGRSYGIDHHLNVAVTEHYGGGFTSDAGGTVDIQIGGSNADTVSDAARGTSSSHGLSADAQVIGVTVEATVTTEGVVGIHGGFSFGPSAIPVAVHSVVERSRVVESYNLVDVVIDGWRSLLGSAMGLFSGGKDQTSDSKDGDGYSGAGTRDGGGIGGTGRSTENGGYR